MRNKITKNYKLLTILAVLLLFCILLTLFLWIKYRSDRDNREFKNMLINANIDDYASLIKNMDQNFILYNKDGSQCNVYLLDKHIEIQLDNLSKNNKSCSLMIRKDDHIVYKSKNDFSVSQYPPDPQFFTSDFYYYNIETKKHLQYSSLLIIQMRNMIH